MTSRHSTMSVLAGCALLALATGLSADWPQWRGPNRDGKAAGFTAPQAWPAQLTQKWKVASGISDATPALVGDKLYVFARQGGDEVLLCLDAATGKEVWKDGYPTAAPTGADRGHAGPRSSPAVADGKVVTLGLNATISCLDAASGKVLWRKEAAKEGYAALPRFHTAMSPLIVDGLAIVQLGGDGGGAIMAYELANGNVKWKWAGEGAAYASPAVLTAGGVKQIVTLTEKSAVGVAADDGKLLWQVPFAPAGRMAYNAATPIIEGQTVIICGGGRGTKALSIDKQGDAFTAKELWSNADIAPQFNTPVLKDGLLFGLSDKSNLYCVNAKTGALAWTDSTKRANFGAIVDAGSVLLALPNTSELVVFQPSDKAFTEVAHYKVADKQTYGHPVADGKRIFVQDQESVVLWTVE